MDQNDGPSEEPQAVEPEDDTAGHSFLPSFQMARQVMVDREREIQRDLRDRDAELEAKAALEPPATAAGEAQERFTARLPKLRTAPRTP